MVLIDAPDNSVIIADSQEVHGVTQSLEVDNDLVVLRTVTVDLQQSVFMVNRKNLLVNTF